MKTRTKVALAVLCALLLVTVSILGTVAYLKKETTTITNTFTYGQVDITLDETKVDVYGDAVVGEGAGRFPTGNTYKLIPGHQYTKDPVIHVVSGSEPCYVYAEVVNGLSAIETGTTIADQMTAKGWEKIDGTNVYYKQTAVDASQNNVDVPVFDNFTISGDAVVSDYGTATVTVKGYAVQADGFVSAEAAWNATFGAPVTP